MNIVKKAALLAATAGTMVIVGATGASAAGGGGGGVQSNDCDTRVGTILDPSVAGPTGDIEIGSSCINIDYGGSAFQSNDCDTAAGIVTNTAGAAPSGDIKLGSSCSNISYPKSTSYVRSGGSSYNNNSDGLRSDGHGNYGTEQHGAYGS
ncbi:hypothetical protein [Streptomyces milbemycinicus]|uniref:hypothetical protein n=1 Tax=Streptomyces milbemycinicus TaxID=476552 RepID=UPI00340273F5